jgi:arylsulfatase A-like enzyme
VALTGDHSYWIAKGVGSDEEFKRYAVPFFLSVPDRLKPKSYDQNNFGSHEDIFPTLYPLTLSEQEYLKLGEDLISEPGIAQNSAGIVADHNGAYHHGEYWNWKSLVELSLVQSKATPELELLKAKAESLIGLTDHYLKEEKARKSSVVKNGRK